MNNLKPEIMACVYAYNDEYSIGGLVLRTLKYVDQVIVCEDGSNDLTGDIAVKLGASVLRHENHKGYRASIQSLFIEALRIGADLIVTLDVRHNPEDIPKLLNSLETDALDIVVGSYDIRNENSKSVRALDLSDFKSMFRAYNRRAIEFLVSKNERMERDEDILLESPSNGLKIGEILIPRKSVKLVVMIPAYNEEDTIGEVLKDIPRNIEGISKVDVLLIEDGSTDNTLEVAMKYGVDKVIHQIQRVGLAKAFEKGLETALEMDADIIVNIDADNQYNPKEIPILIRPILYGEADIVLGDRQIDGLTHMSSNRKLGNKIASLMTRRLSGLDISDAQTGFRAFSSRAASMLNVLSDYTYTQETIIQAAYKKLKIVEVPIEFRKREGDSRLISNLLNYAKRSGLTILLTYLNYKPLKAFLFIGLLITFIGFLFGFRVLIHFVKTGFVTPYVPSAILTAILIIVGFQVIILGLFATMIRSNRELIERILYKTKEMRE